MNINPSKGLAVLSLFLGTACGSLLSSAHAQTLPVTITVDENGNGSLVFDDNPPNPLSAALIADPGPGGLASALTYNLGGPPSLTAGDLVIHDPSSGTSDLVRFNPLIPGTPYPSSLVFYSIAGEGALADTGFPLASYTNEAFATEGVDGVTTYHPTQGQPGFIGGTFDVTYIIQSSPETTRTPDSGSGMALLGLGLASLICFRRLGH
jgi:hypothetical protein